MWMNLNSILFFVSQINTSQGCRSLWCVFRSSYSPAAVNVHKWRPDFFVRQIKVLKKMGFQRSKKVEQRLMGRSKITPERSDVIYGWSLKLPSFLQWVACVTGRKGHKNCAQNKIHIFFSMKTYLRLSFEWS